MTARISPEQPIPTLATLFQKKFPTFARWLAVARWQYIYYALAIFNLLTVSTSLYLSHKIMDIYTQSIEVNHQWAVRLETYSTLGQLLAALNAPGNNVFDSGDVALESKRLESAVGNFQKHLDMVRQELQAQVDRTQAKPLLEHLDAVKATTVDMVAEARLIFSYFRQNQDEMAGRHMAIMDRQYYQANAALSAFRQHVNRVQQNFLEQQKTTADALRKYEFAIAGATLLMVSGVTWYGHQLAQKMKSEAQKKEQSITELQQAEVLLKEQTLQLQLALDNLQKTQMQLIQNEKMSSLGSLVAGVAHEINNPVNFIHGNLPYVRDYTEQLLALIQLYQVDFPKPTPAIEARAEEIDLEFLQKDLIKLLDSMQLGTNRIRQIVLSLRNFSRMDEADFKAVDIHEGIDSTLLILKHRLKSKPEHPAIEVIKDYDHLPPVECFAGQLNQVFMNILSNAIDALEESMATAHPETTPTITIRTGRLDADWVQIAIADNGVGISEQTQKRIFEPFFTTKSVGKGTGLGMSISYQIITEKHRGQLKCLSMPRQGTEFVVQIPIQQQGVKLST